MAAVFMNVLSAAIAGFAPLGSCDVPVAPGFVVAGFAPLGSCGVPAVPGFAVAGLSCAAPTATEPTVIPHTIATAEHHAFMNNLQLNS
jgi:hypothetical protein